MDKTVPREGVLAAKLFKHGPSAMPTEELVETLLIYTHSARKEEFPSLSRRLCTAPSTPLLDEGVEALLSLCEEIFMVCQRRMPPLSGRVCRSLEDCARLFVETYRFIDKEATLLLLLDNRMRVLSMEYVSEGGVDSARFHSEAVIKKAILRHASAAVIGVNRRKGIAVPTSEEIHALRYLRKSMKNAGVPLLSGVVVSDGRYSLVSVEEEKTVRPLSEAELAADPCAADVEEALPCDERRRLEQDLLLRLLSYAEREGAERILYGLLRRGIDLYEALSGDCLDLLGCEEMTQRATVLLTTVGELFRRQNHRKERGRTPLDERGAATLVREMCDGSRAESVYLLLVDEERCLIAVEKLGSGVANAAAILPRRLLELLLFHRASGAYLLHTHPSGVSMPSAEDIAVTRALKRTFSDAACVLLEHIIVADGGFTPILSYMEKNGIE